MGIKEILNKVTGHFSNKEPINNEKITPYEMELRSYKRREYLDNVKKQVEFYRKKDTSEFLGGKYLHKQEPILHNKNTFKSKKIKKSKPILNGRIGW